jgi:hypothetical protein
MHKNIGALFLCNYARQIQLYMYCMYKYSRCEINENNHSFALPFVEKRLFIKHLQ